MSDSHFARIPVESFWESEILVLGHYSTGPSAGSVTQREFEFPKGFVLVLTDVTMYPVAELSEPYDCAICEIVQVIEVPYSKRVRFRNQVTKDCGCWNTHFTTGLRIDAAGSESGRFFLQVKNQGHMAGIHLIGYVVKEEITDAVKEVTEGIDLIETAEDILGGLGLKSAKPVGQNFRRRRSPARTR